MSGTLPEPFATQDPADAWEWYRGIIVCRLASPPELRWRWHVAEQDAKRAFERVFLADGP
ncbi:MAG: hypothetical protein ACRD5L_03305 [Bryobacteraceae bacterium]